MQLLRAGEALDVWGALFAESTAYSMLQAGPELRRWLGSPLRRAPGPPVDPPHEPAVIVAREGAHVRS